MPSERPDLPTMPTPPGAGAGQAVDRAPDPPVRFAAVDAPDAALAAAAAATAPENAMLTPAWAAALAATGTPPVLLAGWRGDRLVTACYATVREGRVRRTLAVESWPGGAPAGFDAGFGDYCERRRADVVEVNTFGSPAGPLPELTGRLERRARLEHLWELTAGDLRAALSSNHRRNVSRALKAGVTVAEGAGEGALAAHARLSAASLTRRADRGETVTGDAARLAWWAALTASGAGRLLQASAADGEVLSSILILVAARGAYYQSAGTSPRGMELGASQRLVLEVATRLAAEGRTVFNLGGAEESNPGLHRFKTAFGTRPVALEGRRWERTRSWRARAVGAVRTLTRRGGSSGAPAPRPSP